MKNILLKSIKSIHTFMNNMKQYIQVDDNKRQYIIFKVDIYFSEYSLAIEIN